MDVSAVKALTFDVFGTVVDWRSTIIRACISQCAHAAMTRSQH
jgi:FMN phosphatase YigB (HAD superfamily)